MEALSEVLSRPAPEAFAGFMPDELRALAASLEPF